MSILLIVIGSILLALFSGILAAITVNYKNWKYYSKYYKLLKKGNWYTSGSPYNHWENDSLPDMLYFENEGDIKLKDHVYLWPNHICNLDPYFLYWQLKYNRWFKNNVLNQYTLYTVV